jgi:hypothetical protein
MAFHSSIFKFKDSNALKVVAGKVSLCVALKQGLVGPNDLAKALYKPFYWQVKINQKGNQVNIPELQI